MAERKKQADPQQPHWIVVRMTPGPRQPGRPYYRHAAEVDAVAEARRLAEKHRGERFSVYAAAHGFQAMVPK